jgi:hypothetical protein
MNLLLTQCRGHAVELEIGSQLFELREHPAKG